ncbi:hypothetical protein QWI17_18175 [Gilvimarinus sp. SDUM040013]|uniref:Uncharacterized protein n=1 Tax=Gilvimarinus gilvus TaxID=3058038 RepID=A0ABU4S322_9GAMM|nr:hypothetical protein [Gilvimarinus sp. SDUM040013]MDO3387776.1 hypothetical protein [Gilvimarinus sp. SDUM040013]MDX6851551.1 hypothetical protein [Gilvimarinus sp. SDUM040013]
MESIFRGLVVFAAVLSLIFWSMPYFDYMWLSNEQLYLLDQDGFGAVIPTSHLTYWGTLVVWLVLLIGLFFFNRFARIGFVAFYFFSVVLGLCYGLRIHTAYEVTILNLMGLADGAIIAIAYLTSVGAKFEKQS